MTAISKRRPKGHGTVRQRSAGSFELRYSLGTDAASGHRKVATATFRGTRAEAEKELRRRLHTLDEGSHVDPSRLTVSAFVEQWLGDWASVNVTPKTFERYGELLRNHVAKNIGHVLLQKLRAIDLNGLYANLMRAERPLAPRTVGHVHRVMHRALGHARKWQMVNVNVADDAEPPPVEEEEVAILSSEQVQTVLERLRGSSDEEPRALYPIVQTALGTGMRRGELLALRWKDVDLDNAFVRVERSLEQTKAGLRFKAPKTRHGRRNITLPAFCVAALRAHWTAQQELRLSIGAGKAPPDALVFARFDGEPRKPGGVTKTWGRVAESLGLAITFHALRHTHASSLIASGLDVMTISRRLGHGSAAITLRVYGHLFTNTDGRAAAALDIAFAKKP